MEQQRIELYGMTEKEMREAFSALGYPAFRGSQVFKHLYEEAPFPDGAVSVFDTMTDLPKKMREEMTARETGIADSISAAKDVPGVEDGAVLLDARLPVVLERQVAKDGTCKYLFGLSDGEAIEAVFMKYEYGNSLCVSSQVGCRMGCRFCASTRRGLVRDLTAAEMVGQVIAAERDRGEPVGHIVIMGIGEPFDNYENVGRFLDILHEPKGKNMSYRNMTVSTCGLVEKIRAFGDDHPTVNLAISLHAPNDELRKKTMPVANRYTVREIVDACREHAEKTGRRVTYEYALIKDVNATEGAVQELADLLRGTLCHVNLIPLNEVEESDFHGISRQEAEEIAAYLTAHGVPATVRRSLGRDIDAACGQLRSKAEDNSR